MDRITQSWLTADTTQQVCAALMADGAQAYFVGGCVRNALLGAPISDLDIATDALPATVMQLAQAAGIKAVPTGIDHGTVTLVVDRQPFEVTTFRKDVATDGRRAVVAFSGDMAEDAARRDFTMNALYADATGRVFDPLGGLGDLNARYVRFIGTATHRIREDYLRTLRYFRFHAWYGNAANGMDADALAAIAENLDGLPQLSRERVGGEIVKLMAAPDPAPAVAAMRHSGVLSAVLPGAEDRALAPLIHLEQTVAPSDSGPDAILRLAALGDTGDLADRLRLSKSQAKRHGLLRDASIGTKSAAELAYRIGAKDARAAMVLRSAVLEMPTDPELETDLARGHAAQFPVSARDLMPGLAGAAIGTALKQLETDWIASGFTLDRATLLARLG